jgi:hypothetical protein
MEYSYSYPYNNDPYLVAESKQYFYFLSDKVCIKKKYFKETNTDYIYIEYVNRSKNDILDKHRIKLKHEVIVEKNPKGNITYNYDILV